MLIYDFKCQDCGELTEGWASSADTDATIKCEHCGGTARRIISPIRFKLDGCSGDFPTAYDQWEKKREQKMKQERKASYYEGDNPL